MSSAAGREACYIPAQVRLTHECVSLSRKICGFCASEEEDAEIRASEQTLRDLHLDTDFLTGMY